MNFTYEIYKKKKQTADDCVCWKLDTDHNTIAKSISKEKGKQKIQAMNSTLMKFDDHIYTNQTNKGMKKKNHLINFLNTKNYTIGEVKVNFRRPFKKI